MSPATYGSLVAKLMLDRSKILHDFILPGAEYEVNVSSSARGYTQCLIEKGNSHPDMFLVIFREIVEVLERDKLPAFLNTAKGNK
jgi:Regulator of G protein signaling domain